MKREWYQLCRKIFCAIIIFSSTQILPEAANAQRLCHNQLPITQVGLQNIIIQSNGIERSFLLYKPVGYTAGITPKVVFMFHGSSQDGLKMFINTGWKKEADQDKFLVVFPNSLCYYLKDEQAVKSRWNDGNLKLRPNETGADDVLFFEDMLQWIKNYRDSTSKTGTALVPNKVYISGFSNGAIFCSRLLMEVPEHIIAAAVVSTILPATSITQPNNVVPTIIVYGSKDERLLEALSATAAPFPINPSAFAATPLFNNIISWHLNRNELKNAFASYTDSSKYSLIYNQPINRTGGKRKYLEIQVHKGLTHSYPKKASMMFNDFFKKF